MFSIDLESGSEEKEMLVAELWAAGSTGIVESDLASGRSRLQAFFEDGADAHSLLQQFEAYGVRLEAVAPVDWVAVSRAGWQPMLVGKRYFLVPEWRRDPPPPGRLRIAINPGLACGTGSHEATQLCLEALERWLRPGAVVADVGTGTGIISIAAALLGAGRVIASDDDPAAVAIAAENFRSAETPVLLYTGSVNALASGSADLILSNISAATSIELAPEILRCLATGGHSVTSGFELDSQPAVEAAIEGAGGAILERMVKNNWCALVYSNIESTGTI